MNCRIVLTAAERWVKMIGTFERKMMFGQSAFENKTVIRSRLSSFGFVREPDGYVYQAAIADGQLKIAVKVWDSGKVKTTVYDPDTGDEYVLHLTDAVGAFVGRVRTDCAETLQKIADNCFETKLFTGDYAAKIVEHIREKYQDRLEFLWEKFPQNAIVRRKDTRKWYALLLTVKKQSLGLAGEQTIEIIDLRMKPEDIGSLVDGCKYFPGYHMNKRHWSTICLDGSVPLEEIYQRIEQSYRLAAR